jgi:hypothetical protein
MRSTLRFLFLPLDHRGMRSFPPLDHLLQVILHLLELLFFLIQGR